MYQIQIDVFWKSKSMLISKTFDCVCSYFPSMNSQQSTMWQYNIFLTTQKEERAEYSTFSKSWQMKKKKKNPSVQALCIFR